MLIPQNSLLPLLQFLSFVTEIVHWRLLHSSVLNPAAGSSGLFDGKILYSFSYFSNFPLMPETVERHVASIIS